MWRWTLDYLLYRESRIQERRRLPTTSRGSQSPSFGRVSQSGSDLCRARSDCPGLVDTQLSQMCIFRSLRRWMCIFRPGGSRMCSCDEGARLGRDWALAVPTQSPGTRKGPINSTQLNFYTAVTHARCPTPRGVFTRQLPWGGHEHGFTPAGPLPGAVSGAYHCGSLPLPRRTPAA